MTFALDHVHLLCDDVELAAAFLRDVIGARELRRNEAIMNWELELGPVRIFVRQRRPEETLADAAIRRAGVDHLGFTVPDIDAAIAQMAEAGGTVLEPRKQLRPDLASAFVLCPGGLLAELLQRG